LRGLAVCHVFFLRSVWRATDAVPSMARSDQSF
jgi:hypothetical protein